MANFLVLVVFALLQICWSLPPGLQRNTQENVGRLLNLGPHDLAEEFSGQIEGDMVLNDEQIKELNEPSSRTGLIDEKYRWPGGIVYYELAPRAFSQEQVDYINLGLRLIELQTCLRFLPRQPENENYIYVTGDNSGCWSFVGQQDGRQELNLQLYPPGSGCFRIGTIMHEFIHAIGFYHMQSATERDTYVEIVWENIRPGTENNFNSYPDTRISNFGIPYDYESVMHYSAYAFSINGEKTIIAIFDPEADMGQRLRLTERDVARMNNKYCR